MAVHSGLKQLSVYCHILFLGTLLSFSTQSTATAMPSIPAGTRASLLKLRRKAAGVTVSELVYFTELKRCLDLDYKAAVSLTFLCRLCFDR